MDTLSKIFTPDAIIREKLLQLSNPTTIILLEAIQLYHGNQDLMINGKKMTKCRTCYFQLHTNPSTNTIRIHDILFAITVQLGLGLVRAMI